MSEQARFGVVILTMGKRPDDLARGITSVLEQVGVEADPLDASHIQIAPPSRSPLCCGQLSPGLPTRRRHGRPVWVPGRPQRSSSPHMRSRM